MASPTPSVGGACRRRRCRWMPRAHQGPTDRGAAEPWPLHVGWVAGVVSRTRQGGGNAVAVREDAAGSPGTGPGFRRPGGACIRREAQPAGDNPALAVVDNGNREIHDMCYVFKKGPAEETGSMAAIAYRACPVLGALGTAPPAAHRRTDGHGLHLPAPHGRQGDAGGQGGHPDRRGRPGRDGHDRLHRAGDGRAAAAFGAAAARQAVPAAAADGQTVVAERVVWDGDVAPMIPKKHVQPDVMPGRLGAARCRCGCWS